MDLNSIHKKKQGHPSKLIALIAFMVAISLPMFLVKTFGKKEHSLTMNTVISNPAQSTDNVRNKPTSLTTSTVEKQTSTSTTLLSKAIIKKDLPLPKGHKARNAAKKNDNWEVVTTKDGDTLAAIFQKLGINKQTLPIILQDNPHKEALSNIKPNQKLQFAYQKEVLDKLIIPHTLTQSLVITRHGDEYKTEINSRKVTSHNHYITASVEGSLYGTAKRMGIPYKLISQMATIFNWEIDFSRDVRDGDRFTIVYKAIFLENTRVGTGEIIAATYTTSRGKTYKAIRHTNQDDDVGYYDEYGKSLKKAFTRYPLKFSHISSTFSLSRMHPVLKKRRPHKGVDLAAPIGTPIRAVGDGKIISIGRDNGYGNMIKIHHNNTYNTVYAHMLRFQKGLSKGSRVKRGQIIGYVGQTGLATGPHCHFEFHIKKQPKNPTTVELPRASPVPKKDIASFRYNAGALLAHMKLFEEAHIASEQHTELAKA
jgi:murein DD-endopeptidase MepM/ murein hydrolase activator NlpD